MNEARFTPGPWLSAGPVGYSTGILAEGGWIALAYGQDTNPQCADNVALITAAPEMYAALKLAESFIADESATREQSCLPEPNEDEEGYLESASTALDTVRAAIAKAEGRQ